MAVEIKLIEEFRIGGSEHDYLQPLLSEAFPGYFDNRIYFKQLPTFRLIARDAGEVVGQVGIVHRIVRLGESPLKIFGIADLAVDTRFRRCGIGKLLLIEAQRIAIENLVDFIVLFADDHRLYTACGFTRKENECVWLKIDEHRTLGIGTEKMGDCLMVKELGLQKWNGDAQLDLLGYMF